MPTLAGILVVVAYNMSEWENFVSMLKGQRSDIAVLTSTFLLTVFVDLTVAIEVGMLLAMFLFLRRMIKSSDVRLLSKETDQSMGGGDSDSIDDFSVSRNIEIFEITGPLFFGAAYKFKDAIKQVEKPPKILIIRMRHVPIVDATGIKALMEVHRESKHRGTKLILSEVNSEQVMQELRSARLLFAIGKANVTSTFEEALQRSTVILDQLVTSGS
jgi:SulP family sulfate permease